MRGQRNSQRAFTLAEMMMALGLMGILMSVAAVPASDMLRNVRQTELDNMARTLYMNAQMGLTAAKLSGQEINVRELEAALSVRSANAKLKLVKSEEGEWRTELSDTPDLRLWRNDPKLREDGENGVKALRDILFPPRSDGRGNAELSGGYWAIAFDPCALSVVSAYFSRDDGADAAAYFRDLYDDANREDRLSELALVENRLRDGALIGYYGPESAAVSVETPFAWIANDAPETGGASETEETEATPANNPQRADNLSRKICCWIGYDEDAPIFNGETLATRLNCWIPADSAFEIGNRPADVYFSLTVTGASSRKSKTFRYKMEAYGTKLLCRDMETGVAFDAGSLRTEEREAANADGRPVTVSGWLHSYPVILDSPLDDGEGVPLRGNRPFKARFPDFIPGEDIALQFEADVDESVRKAAKQAAFRALSDGEKDAYGLGRISERAIADDESGAYDWLWKSHRPGWNERPACNSLFADTGGLSNGVYTAKIACARHLRNLDAEISGFGESATSVRALQVADIGLADAFAPVRNDKLTEYDGGGFRIDNLQIGLTGQDAQGAGLFGVLSGDVTLKNLTLTNPVVLSDTESGVGALVGKADADSDVKFSDITIISPVIRAGNASGVGGLIGEAGADSDVKFSDITIISPVIRAGNASGVGGLIGEAGADSHVTASSVQLYMSPESCGGVELHDVLDKWLVGGECVGGLIGYAAGDVAISGNDGVPTFAAAVVNASAYAGGLAGYVAGKLDIHNAWADCYLKSGACVGGLAGYCAPDSAFRRCYAAGFVVGAETAAGFAPCDARSVSDAYSILNFGGLPLVKYGLLRDAPSVSDAYFAYAGETAGGVGAEIGGDALKTALSAENGFRIGGAPAAPYGLSDAQSGAAYPYPALGGTHYNDYLVRERPAPTDSEPDEAEIIVDLAFGDMITKELALYGPAEHVEDFGFWDGPEALRDALDAAQFASAWGVAGCAALKIKGAAGTSLRQSLGGLDFAGFALDEENSTLDKELTLQSPEEPQDGGFTLSYLRVSEDPQGAEAWSGERWAE